METVKRHLDEFPVDVANYGTILCDLYLSVDLVDGDVNDVAIDTTESLFYCAKCGCEIRLSEPQLRAVKTDAMQELSDNWDETLASLPSREVADEYAASRRQ